VRQLSYLVKGQREADHLSLIANMVSRIPRWDLRTCVAPETVSIRTADAPTPVAVADPSV
jgi:hypothetical protein